MKNTIVTVFRDLYKSTDVPYHMELWKVVERIRVGKSQELIKKIKNTESKDDYRLLKNKLPAILFQGRFTQRNDNGCEEASGLQIHDYDGYKDEKTLIEAWETIISNPHTVLAFLSPGGKGIKSLIKIPVCDKKDYKLYFKQFDRDFKIEGFDNVTSNFSRVCFESYDPNLYVNYSAKIYDPELIDEGYEVAERIAVLNITEEDKIIDKIMKFNWSRSLVEGQRNAYILDIAGAFCEYGVTQHSARNYIINNVCAGQIGDGFTEREVQTTIRQAYKLRQPNTKFFEDYAKLDKIQSDFNEPKEAVIKKYNISEEAYDELRENFDHQNFWSISTKKGTKTKTVKINSLRYKYFLERHGFKKHFPFDSLKPIFLKIEGDKVEETSTEKIKDFILTYLINNDELLVWEHCCKSNQMFTELYLSMLETIELLMLKDTKDSCRIAYMNGILEVTADSAVLHQYVDIEGYVWRSQIIQREFVETKNNNNDYKKFVSNISNNNPLPMECVIGYLISNYKNKMNNKAIILNDEVISDNPEGGTGKGLLIQGIKQIRNVSILDGKSFDEKKSFPYQTISQDTNVLVWDDVKKNFDFELKFSLVTEGITLERKNKDAIKLSVEESPKMVVTTNYAIKGEGHSHDRRRHEIEIAQYYGKDITPYTEFGHQLFDDWSLGEFQQFDNYVIQCIQSFLKHGLVQQLDAKNIKMRKFIAETAMEFNEWISDTELVKMNSRLDKTEYYNKFIEEYPDFRKWLKRKRFQIWIQKYCSMYDYKYLSGNTNGVRWFCISGNGELIDEPQIDF